MNKIIRLPLLKDRHNHLSFYSALSQCTSLQKITQKEEALSLLEKLTRDHISVVLGWNSGYYTFSAHDLHRLPPVVIVNFSLHSIMMSPAAVEILKDHSNEIIANYTNPEWYEANMARMMSFIAGLTPITGNMVNGFFEKISRLGVAYAADMVLTGEAALKAIKDSRREKTEYYATMEIYQTLSPWAQEKVKGIKLFTDGALGSGTAAIGKPFQNGSRGYLLHSDDSLALQLSKVSELNKWAAIHAIGEDATDQTLRILKSLIQEGKRFPGIRMEHCQFITLENARLAADLGVILSMQPNFNEDSIIYRDRLPAGYPEWNNPFRMIIDQAGFIPGKNLIFGSDGMPHGAEAALRNSLFPQFPHQRLTLDEFTAAYCMPNENDGYIEFVQTENEISHLSINIPQ